MVLSVAFPTYAGVFFDDFADGIANGWHEIAGEWEMLDGAYTLKAPSEKPDQIAMSILDSPWVITDATITFTISFDERDVTGAERPMVFFRLEEDDSGYAFRFEGEPKGTTIGMIEVGVWSSIRGDATDAIELDEPSTIRLEIAANIFMVYHNDVLRQRVGDVKRKFEMGRVGIGASSVDSPIHFEEIRVEGDGVTQFVQDLQPVSAQGKVTLAWAQLRR